MKFLKCTVSGSESSFVKGKLYPVISKGNYNVHLRCDSYRVTSENWRVMDVPLNGAVWEFVLLDISLEQMYFNYSKNKEFLCKAIEAGIKAGFKEWSDPREYIALINPELENTHVVFFESRTGVNGVDSGNVEIHKPDVELFEVSGEIFLSAFLQEMDLLGEDMGMAKEEKPRVPRVRRKRKTPPKKTTTSATLRYKNGDSFTFRNVKNVSLVGDVLSIITEKKVEEGISQRVLNKIDSKLVRSVMLDSPKGVEEVYQDYFLDGQWMVYAEDRTIMNSKMFELRF